MNEWLSWLDQKLVWRLEDFADWWLDRYELLKYILFYGVLVALLVFAGRVAFGAEAPPLPLGDDVNAYRIAQPFAQGACPGGPVLGLGFNTDTGPYTMVVSLYNDRAVIVDAAEGDDTVVWFVRIQEGKFVVVKTARYGDVRTGSPCDYLDAKE